MSRYIINTGFPAMDLLASGGKRTEALTRSGLVAVNRKNFYPFRSSSITPNINRPYTDFYTIYRAIRVDSYIRQAIDKFYEGILREGWTLKGNAPESIDYLYKRFRIFRFATRHKYTIDEMIKEAARDLVQYGNIFVLRSRYRSANPIPGLKLSPIFGYSKPISGYWIIPARSVRIETDDTGRPISYDQYDGERKLHSYPSSDVMHFKYSADGFEQFGHSIIEPVIDDVRILRDMEGNIAELVAKYLYPTYHAQVGTLDKNGTIRHHDDSEVQHIMGLIQNMAPDGVLVTGPHVELKAIGAESQAIRASEYLKASTLRVISGIGTDVVSMGQSQYSTASSSETVQASLHSRIIAFQVILESMMEIIVSELLMEGGFDIIEDANLEVKFMFKAVEKESKYKEQANLLGQFQNNVISIDEIRDALGLPYATDEVLDRMKFRLMDESMMELESELAQKNQPVMPAGSSNANAKNSSSESLLNTMSNILEALYSVRINGYIIENREAIGNMIQAVEKDLKILRDPVLERYWARFLEGVSTLDVQMNTEEVDSVVAGCATIIEIMAAELHKA